MGNVYSLKSLSNNNFNQRLVDWDLIRHLELDIDELALNNSQIIGKNEVCEFRKSQLKYKTSSTSSPSRNVMIRIFNEPCDGKSFWTQFFFARNLHHPNITSIKGYIYNTNHCILVSNYGCKGTLRDLLDSKKVSGLPFQQILSFAKDIILGLQYLTSRGVKYTILNSKNIVIEEIDCFENPIPLSAVLSDLGSSNIFWGDNSSSSSLSRSDYLHTLSYTFGILLWEIFTGLVPKSYLPPLNPQQADSSTSDCDYYLPEAIPDDCPIELSNLIYLCWTKTPSLRISLNEILDVLNHIEARYFGNAVDKLYKERIERTILALQQEVDNLLFYIQKVAKKQIDVNDLKITLQDLKILLTHHDTDSKYHFDLITELLPIRQKLEILEALFPSKIAKNKKLNKYWAEFSSSKKARSKIEHIVGELVEITSLIQQNLQQKNRVQSTIQSSKLVQQILYDNLAPGFSKRIKTEDDKKTEKKFEDQNIKNQTNSTASQNTNKNNDLGHHEEADINANSNKSSTLDLFSGFALSDGISGAFGVSPTISKSSNSKINIKDSDKKQKKEKEKNKKEKSKKKEKASDASTTLNSDSTEHLDISMDEYMHNFVSGQIGKSIYDRIDRNSSSSQLLSITLSNEKKHEGKQFYGEELGYGPQRRPVPAILQASPASKKNKEKSSPNQPRSSNTNNLSKIGHNDQTNINQDSTGSSPANSVYVPIRRGKSLYSIMHHQDNKQINSNNLDIDDSASLYSEVDPFNDQNSTSSFSTPTGSFVLTDDQQSRKLRIKIDSVPTLIPNDQWQDNKEVTSETNSLASSLNLSCHNIQNNNHEDVDQSIQTNMDVFTNQSAQQVKIQSQNSQNLIQSVNRTDSSSLLSPSLKNVFQGDLITSTDSMHEYQPQDDENALLTKINQHSTSLFSNITSPSKVSSSISSSSSFDSNQSSSALEKLNWDPDAKLFWRTEFGSSTNIVPWNRFVSSLSEHIILLPSDAKLLKRLLDHNDAGYVSISTFSDYLNSHGPLKSCIQRTKSYCNENWFLWYLNHNDCISILKHCPNGSFVVRFSQSSPGHFAITFKQNSGSFMKSLIHSHHGKYKPSADDKLEYDSILELTRASTTRLIPFDEGWHRKAWFRGVMEAEESMQLLQKLPTGSFFVRLDSNDSHFVFAIVISEEQVIQEAFIMTEPEIQSATQDQSIQASKQDSRDPNNMKPSPNKDVKFVIFGPSSEVTYLMYSSMEDFVEKRREYHLNRSKSTAQSSS